MSAPLERGARAGPYSVEALLGMGGMGAVYRARDVRLGRVVALKVVRPGREDRTGVDPADRLLAEAQAAAALRHPHVVEIYDAGVADGLRYVAMEYVEGKPLRAFVGDRSVPLGTRLRWLREIASALGAAHGAGLVHRDVKPENVMIDRDGCARVLDFGIAKRFVHDTTAPTAQHAALETAEGRVLGTLAYMAPEQLAGGAPAPAWDQFAWGVVAYELLTGVHPRHTVPMPGPTAHLSQTPRLPSELAPEVGFETAACVLRAMAPDASRRFSSMEEVGASMAAPPSAPSRPVAAWEHRTGEGVGPAPRAPRQPARGLVAWLVALLLIAGLGAVLAVLVVLVWLRAEASPGSTPPAPVVTVVDAARVATGGESSPDSSADALPSPSPTTSVASRPAAAPSRSRVSLPAPSSSSGGACFCVSGRSLCPLGTVPELRSCTCHDERGFNLSQNEPEGTWRSGLHYEGLGLAEGRTCTGYGGEGQPLTRGSLSFCETVCDKRSFRGSHRAPCRGLDPIDGRVLDGTLACY